jgi:hypothetical protein
MIYEVLFETNFGEIRAIWRGGPYVELFTGADDTAKDVINVWDYKTDEPRIPREAAALAKCVKEWLWEMERGIEFETMRLTETMSVSEADWE